MTDKYAVIGNPIAHSKSPAIHAMFAKQTNQNMAYESILAPLDSFTDTVNQLIVDGYHGVNVTVPFKVDAYNLMNEPNMEGVHDAEAVNTLTFENSRIKGANTDGIGLVTDIQNNLGFDFQNKKVLLIGAGGAAQGVAYKIAEKNPELFVVANRSLEKVHEMKKRLERSKNLLVTPITVASFEELGSQSFDIIVNATSASLKNTRLPISNLIFADRCLAYDMMYGQETPFMAQARAKGANVADGLGMLVEQAAEAFTLWRGVRPDAKAVIDKMRVV